ncbi:Calcineurin subunit B type 2 [Nowakowskiella sp. JEL0407]|nr:Calcineurin subunit B type 2 [Nowakowskiella sp. JEL0407]
MGQSSSASILQDEEIEELQSISSLSPEQIVRLYSRFKQLDKENSGTLSYTAFAAIPELAMNPLANRIVSVFDSEGRSEVNFKQFATALSVFSRETKREQKLLFAFKIYDVNNDGYIDSNDLKIILRLMIGDNLDEAQIQDLANKTILEADTIDKDGAISFEEFKRTMFNADLENKLTIEL